MLERMEVELTLEQQAKLSSIAAADRGEFVEHDDIRKIIDSRYPA
jgi:predicted transcriptional regulator